VIFLGLHPRGYRIFNVIEIPQMNVLVADSDLSVPFARLPTP
jgi:hypothetical protein